jgi:hypothetical protein
MSVRCELSEMRESTATFGCAAGFGRVGDMRGGAKAATGSARGERGGVHRFGVPPNGDANFAWVQDFSRHLAPEGMTEVGSVCLRFAVAGLANDVGPPTRQAAALSRAHFQNPGLKRIKF